MIVETEDYIKDFRDFLINKVKDSTQYIGFVEEISEFDFLDLVSKLAIENKNYFYWNEPKPGFSILGIDSVYSININGSNRVLTTQNILNDFQLIYQSNSTDFDINCIPVFMGGIKFTPNDKSEIWKNYSDSDWTLPKYGFVKYDGKYFYIFNAKLNTDIDQIIADYKFGLTLKNTNRIKISSNGIKVISDETNSQEDKNNWKNTVNSALELIQNGTLHKIVISRGIQFELSGTPQLAILLEKLNERYPYCYIYAFRKGSSIFIGASPEKLAKFRDGFIEADALAGSTPRGNTLEEDEHLANDLLNSRKNLNEQQAVVNFISDSFKSFAHNVEYPNFPVIRKLPNIQHLWTPIKAKLNNRNHLFSFLKELHPTPAICGVPWQTSMNYINKMESHSRGLYTGALGWFNFNNEGEFAVAIRSALIENNRVYAYAGCGIVDGSDPDIEFEETKLKLKPILNLFRK